MLGTGVGSLLFLGRCGACALDGANELMNAKCWAFMRSKPNLIDALSCNYVNVEERMLLN